MVKRSIIDDYSDIEALWSRCNADLHKNVYDLFCVRYIRDVLHVSQSQYNSGQDGLLNLQSLHSYTHEYETLSRDFINQLVTNVYNKDDINAFKFARRNDEFPTGYEYEEENLVKATRDIMAYLRNNNIFLGHLMDVAHDFVMFGMGFSLRTKLGKNKFRYDRILPHNITFKMGIDGEEDLFLVRVGELDNRDPKGAKMVYSNTIQCFEKDTSDISKTKWHYREFTRVKTSGRNYKPTYSWDENKNARLEYDYSPIRVIRTPLANITRLPIGYAFHAYPLLLECNRLMNLLTSLIDQCKSPIILKDQSLILDMENDYSTYDSTVLNFRIVPVNNTNMLPLNSLMEVLERNVQQPYQQATIMLQFLESKLAKMFDTRRFLDQKRNVEMTATEVNTRVDEDTRLLDPFIVKLREGLLTHELLTLLKERGEIKKTDDIMVLYNTTFLEQERDRRMMNKQRALGLLVQLSQTAGVLKQTGVNMDFEKWVDSITEDTSTPNVIDDGGASRNMFNLDKSMLEKIR